METWSLVVLMPDAPEFNFGFQTVPALVQYQGRMTTTLLCRHVEEASVAGFLALSPVANAQQPEGYTERLLVRHEHVLAALETSEGAAKARMGFAP